MSAGVDWCVIREAKLQIDIYFVREKLGPLVWWIFLNYSQTQSELTLEED